MQNTNRRDRENAEALLLRWLEAYRRGDVALPALVQGERRTLAARELSGLAAATKAFVRPAIRKAV